MRPEDTFEAPARMFDPQIHGCTACRDGRDPCTHAGEAARCDRSTAFHGKRWPSPIPVFDAMQGKEGRRYVTIDRTTVYASPAEEEAIRMSAVEQAVMENTLAAEAMGMFDFADPPQPKGADKPFEPYVKGCRYCRDGEVACGLPEACKKQQPKEADNVHLPQHYARFKIEPISFICENGLNFFQGNVVKYVLRHDAKNGLEDIRKAKRYLEMYERYLQGDKEWWK
ncbi:DUF3310 domain-containing protein [uncultured Methylobacterium sp.]|jgi:hypothetical protein|uniref:DUF3310 domain-containing protein n=1 Tax=uncultured Methylobacterium sp. TaxID=157278 RepID=UPI00260BCA5D|nr:DUF3310 domain-containing protein [uncultured Methylobacterium sp.]